MALIPISISIGILCGLWFHFTVLIPWFIAWVGFVAWASFYYAGGNEAALSKSMFANIAGMLQGALFFWVWTSFGSGNMIFLSLLIALFCFVMTIEGNIPILSAIPGQFLGAAAYFGNLGAHNGEIWLTLLNTLICMVIGNLAGLLSAKLPELIRKKEVAQE